MGYASRFPQRLEMLVSPEQRSTSEASWRWRALPGESVRRFNSSGCVLSDDQFTVFGSMDVDYSPGSSSLMLAASSFNFLDDGGVELLLAG